MILLIILLSLL